jgi:amino acid adenylation domain-containing protein
MIQPSGLANVIAFDEPTHLPSIVALFQRQVIRQPYATALELNDKSLTYAALDALSNRLARKLRDLGITFNDVVAICLRRTENLLVGILGVLKAGAAYLPLNPHDPPFRLGRILSQAAARVTVTDSDSKAHLPEDVSQLLFLDSNQAAMTGEDHARIPDVPQPDDLAYVIFTSGTTGSPKGVAVTHGALANVMNDVAHRVAFHESASWLAVTTVSFDIAALELLLPLSYGGKVILASEEQARVGRILAGIIHRKKPTVMQATPITWRILLESGWSGAPGLTILCGGDRLDRDLSDKLIARASAVWNMYGPTETTIWSTADRLLPGEEDVTLGKPLANTEVYILDPERRPLPPGEIGEICIGGAGLARGYMNDPELTSRYFFYADLGQRGILRLYRTGDLGRWNENGKLEFFGRIDHQVKINGFRVELAEIEKLLQRYPGVREAAVLGVGGANNQKRLYAFVVPEGETAIAASGLVAYLAEQLPKYMIPEKFWSLDRLPSTPHGKRDVVALEALTEVEPDLVS